MKLHESKEEMLKTSREKSQVVHKGTIRLTICFSTATIETKRHRNNSFEVLRENNPNFQFFINLDHDIMSQSEIKTTSGTLGHKDFY